jgi:hypothetical protein
MTIYSIGYQRLESPEVLRDIAVRADAIVIDVRSVPTTRKKGFGKNQLAALLGDRYEWRGGALGGRGEIAPQSIERLARQDANSILYCLEEHPVDCHRHHAIAVPLLQFEVDVQHLYRDELILASDLQDALDREDERYQCTESPFADCLPPSQECEACR